MRRIVYLVAAAATASIAATGCIDTIDFDNTWDLAEPAVDRWFDTNESALQVSNGYLDGDMGNVTDFSAAAFTHNGYLYGDFANIDFTARAENGRRAMMAIVGIEGDLTSPDLPLDTPIRTSGWATRDSNSAQLAVTVTGCSGPRADNWEYDQPADEVEVVFVQSELDPELLHVTFVAEFDGRGTFDGRGGTQEVAGSFDMIVPGRGGSDVDTDDDTVTR